MQDAVKSRMLPFALCALSLALGIFCGAAGARSHRGYEVKPAEQVAPTVTSSANDEATVAVLRARIRELEAQLAEREQGEGAEVVPESAENREHERPARGDYRTGGEWLKNFKEKHPERFVAMTNRMAQFRRQQSEQAQTKISFLSAVDPSSQGLEAKAVHERLQELIARREELSERMMRDFENQTKETVRDNFRQQTELMDEIRELNQLERENLVRQLANNLGFGEEDSGEIVETVKQIIEATENEFDLPRRGREVRPPREGRRR